MSKKTRYVILGLLHERMLSGYEIKKIIDMQMKFFWQESYGQIYPVLGELLGEGLIQEAPDVDCKPSERTRTVYAITAKGRDDVKKWFEAENEKETVRNELLLKLFLSTDDDRLVMQKQLMKLHEQSRKQLELFREFREELTQIIALHKNHSQILDVLSLGISQQELYCAWSEELIKRYGESGE
jgi:DNA-binding PadR family transcriptional regulator